MSETMSSPYAVCAHVARGGEHQIAKEEFALMRQAGIRWARTDFDWSGVERKQGEWTFEHLDETVQWAEKAGIQILPILDYDVAWARPAYKHLDAWREYVRQVVTRYRYRIRYWEVYNEPNLEGFWKEKPDPGNYVTLLKAAYQEIKTIDPDLKVLICGFAGIPWEFIEGVYEAGGSAYFDIMNVHPYRYPRSPGPGKLYEDLQHLRERMTANGDGEKPIWITEIGWPTHSAPTAVAGFMKPIIDAGMEAIAPGKPSRRVVLLDDPAFPNNCSRETVATVREIFAPEPVRTITLPELASLTVAEADVLVFPPSETFPADPFDAVEAFVRDGGTVLLWSGVPLYYEMHRKADGEWDRKHAPETFRQRLHIGWEAWWTKEGVPEKSSKTVPTEAYKDVITFPDRVPKATRFLTDSALKPGDTFVPLAYGIEKEYRGVAAAAYALDSDLKGGVIVLMFTAVGRNVTEDRQGMICPRAYLVALQAGVERMFWYEFQAVEHDPFYNEHHFGMVHRDLSLKPAYSSLAVLTRFRPAGSEVRPGEWRSDEEVYFPHWRRPDGTMVWALWKGEGTVQVRLTMSEPPAETFDHLGRPKEFKVPGDTVQVELDESIFYIIGPEKIGVTVP